MTPPVASRAQTAFFSVGFANLHQLVLEQLAEVDSRHPVLPLLHVSRYWRIITRDFLLEPYQMTKLDPKSWEKDPKHGYPDCAVLTKGAFVKFALSHYNIYDEARETDDPRYLFTPEGSKRPTVHMLLQSCDPSTLVCTFIPADSEEDEDANPFKEFGITLPCDPADRAPSTEFVPTFVLVPSTWFIKREASKTAVWGHDVACAPGMYPQPGPLIDCPLPELPGEGEAIHDNERNGWSVDFGLLREDFPDDELDEDEMNSHVYDCPASVMMRSAKIPLAGLYHPPGLSRTKTFADYD